MKFKDRLRVKIQKAGITQAQACERLNRAYDVSLPHFKTWLSGKFEPSFAGKAAEKLILSFISKPMFELKLKKVNKK